MLWLCFSLYWTYVMSLLNLRFGESTCDESIWNLALDYVCMRFGYIGGISLRGSPHSFLFLVVSVVSLWGGARSLLILIMVIELHNKYFRLLLWVCIWVVINYQKGGDWKCNHALNHILMLMTTHMLGTNHVYQVYLRIMFQRPCAWIMTRDKKHITQEWRYKILTSFMVCSWV